MNEQHRPETISVSRQPEEDWKVIIADDEEETHYVTRMVLRNYRFEGRKLCFFSAYSAEETRRLLRDHPDTAIILLDVVMERDDSGLEVVKYIREDLDNRLIQIVLRTGFSGYAPEKKVIAEYGINDYKSKIDLTSEKLYTTITTLLRSYCLSSSYNRLNHQLAEELRKRHLAENQLQQAKDSLEQRVIERTRALEKANRQLKEEIQARIRAEAARQESDEMARALLNATSDIAFLIAPDGTILSINETASRLLDADAASIVNHSIHALFPRNNTNRLQKALERTVEEGLPIVFEENQGGQVFEVRIFPVFGERRKIDRLAIYAHDITDQKKAQQRIHTLTHDLIKAQENERERIARDLHDRVAQDLSSSRILCETLFDPDPGQVPDNVRIRATRLSTMLWKAIHSIRDIAYDLRPPILEQMGLVKAVYRYCEEFSENEGIPIDFNAIGVEKLALSRNMEINLYRLIQEAFNNIRKHAEATRIRINMVASHPNLLLRITDNGRGFHTRPLNKINDGRKRMGLRSMAERTALLSGRLDIQSRPGAGTRILIEVPFSNHQT